MWLVFLHETSYVFAVLCDVVVFGYVVLFAFDVCDFKIRLIFFSHETSYVFPVLCDTGGFLTRVAICLWSL